MATVQYWGVGRRKEATARVRLIPGSGRVIINERSIESYLPTESLRSYALEPLYHVEGAAQRYDVIVRVRGGGISGQAGAIRLGIARALTHAEEGVRPVLKKAGFLTRDARVKERRKYGLKKARKAPQFSKR
ncbi:MAG: 30S ribosomal protein S9 [Clostridiales bacterium]|nr:30S ribosomal protein S9 [Clostridiales bacterium]